MNDVLVIVPSRGRPDRLQTMLAAVTATSERSDVAVYLDDDDPSPYRVANPVDVIYGPCLGLVGSINAVVKACPDYAYYAALGDDHLPRTQGWDTRLVAAIEAHGGTGIAYGDDGLQGEWLPTAPLISADLISGLGWMAPPALRHMFPDNFWAELGRTLGCLLWVPDVYLEHMHFANGKAPMDATYEATNSEEAFEADHAAYKTYMREQFERDVARVRSAVATVS